MLAYFTFFLRGFLIGFSVAATVGPMAVLCIQRTFQGGFRYGFVSGLGIATADGCYGSIAGLGLTILISFLMSIQFWIHLAGGCFLLYFGIRTFFTLPPQTATTISTSTGSLIKAYVSLFVLAAANPVSIMMFVAIFAGMGSVGSTETVWTSLAIVGGVFISSISWWLLLTAGISLFRNRVTTIWLTWVNRLSGSMIFLFGVLSLASLFL